MSKNSLAHASFRAASFIYSFAGNSAYYFIIVAKGNY